MAFYHVEKVWQLALVYEVRKRTFVEEQEIPIDLEFDEIYGQTYRYVLLTEAGHGIATARVNLLSADKAKIERVAVIPDYQGRGYGRRLLEHTEKWLAETDVQHIVITSQTQARGFYEALGYRADESVELESEIPQVYTEKRLNSL